MENKDVKVSGTHAAPVSQPAGEANSPEAFLTRLSETLQASDGVDADLASILSTHLLTVTAHASAVANAKAAIVALAAKRAALDEEKADG